MSADTTKAAQREQMTAGKGFIAALDQSGGSTPKALRLYGVEESAYSSEAEMFDLIHAMRARMATDAAFSGDRVIGAILFEMTMEREIGGKPAATYLWEEKRVVPFLKVDEGLAEDRDGGQLMKPIKGLDDRLARANAAGIYGTKMRSVINAANPDAIRAVVAQQFEIGGRILDAGLVPIIEPEVTISIPDKAAAEDILLGEIARCLDAVPADRQVMLKLTLPDTDNLYAPLIAHDRTQRVVALSGGYSREEANARLARNAGMIASFSRALTEGLSAQQSDDEFHAALDASIQSIYDASVAG